MNHRGASRTVDCGRFGGHRLLYTLCALFSLVACAPQGPDVSGSNTNWLQRCGHDDECFGGSCIDFICTLACEPDDEGACEAVSIAATCRPSTHGDGSVCDVGCSAASDCESLGDGYECDGGFCHVESSLSVESSTISLTLAPSDTGDGTPLVRWVDDHWLLASLTQPPEGDSTVELREFTLWPHGKLKEQRTTAPSTGDSSEHTQRMLSDGVVMERFHTDEGTCALRYFLPDDLDTPISEPDCALARAHAIPGTTEWLVLSATSDGLYTILGRYEPRERRWTVEPQVISNSNPQDFSERVDGEDLVLVRPNWRGDVYNRTQIARIHGTMARKAPNRIPTPEWTRLPSLRLHEEAARSSRIHDWTPNFGLWFLIQSLSESELIPEFEEVPLTVSFVDQRMIMGRLQREPPLILPIQFPVFDCMEDAPEEDLMAIGHLEPGLGVDDTPGIRRDLMLSLFEHSGRRVAGPLRIRKIEQGFEMYACSLTWSDKGSLLVVSKIGKIPPSDSEAQDSRPPPEDWEWRLQVIELD